MGQPRPLFCLFFGLFKQTLQFSQQIYVKKCPSSIRCWDLNPRPLECETPPITTRPGHIVCPLLISFFLSFGVCCLFLVSASGSIINQNCTYIRNPGFPSVYSSTSALSYTIQKCSSGSKIYKKQITFLK